MNFNDKVRAMALRLIGNNDTVKAATEPKVYIALLDQSGTDAPVATVLKNTLGGTVVWTYTSVGFYAGTLIGAFTAEKTVVDFLQLDINNLTLATATYNSVDDIVIYSGDYSTGIETMVLTNAVLNKTIGAKIKIEVYP